MGASALAGGAVAYKAAPTIHRGVTKIADKIANYIVK